MKRILVTGENSYIGTSFVTYMEQFKEEYEVETISVRGDEWRKKDFSIYDVVFHVAAIVHKKETKENEKLYFEVNYTLTKELAEKSKSEGVEHFLFLSTMSVYGTTSGAILKDSKLNPTNAYGKSKLKAENFIKNIETPSFTVTIIRPPMVYGSNCKGNYKTLNNFAEKVFLFPKVNNKRSMIYIKNLTFILKKVIDDCLGGVYCPQNESYIVTSLLFERIRMEKGKKTYLSVFLGFIISKMTSIKIINKIFGDLYYDFFDFDNLPYSFYESIEKIEGRK